MSNTKAIVGIGTKFYRWDGSEFKALAQVISIAGPGMSRTTIDVTTLDTEDGYMEFIGGLRDAGSLTLSMSFTNATYSKMKEDFESDESRAYQIVLPDSEATTLEMEALVTELPLNVEANDRITADVTLKISGKVELSDNTSSGAV